MGIEDSLTAAGVPYGLAAEIIAASKPGGSTTPERLSAMGMAGPTAIELAKQLNSRIPSIPAMLALGIPGGVAEIISSGAGGGGLKTDNILVANRGQMPTALVAFNDQTASMIEHWASPEGDITNLVLTDTNAVISGSFDIALATSANFIKFLEYPLGTFTPVLFGGQAQYTVNGTVSSDPVSSVTIPAGARFWSHTVLVSGAGRTLATIELPAVASAIGVTDTKYVYSGSPQHPAPDASINHFGTALVTGTVLGKTGGRGFAITGDSIAFGQGDVASTGVKGGSGYLARGLDGRFPYAKIAKKGMSGVDLAALASSPALQAFIAAMKVTDLINEFGGGDLRIGTSNANVKSGYQTIYGLFSGKRIGQTTVLPRTDSTDGYATVANQTPKTDGNWAGEVALNADIRAGLPNTSYYLETSDVASTARDSRVWKAPPVPNTDGVHPNDYMAAQIGAYVNGHALAPVLPSAVRTLAVGTPTASAIPYSFAAPLTGSGPITYKVEVKTSAAANWTVVAAASTTLSGSIAGLVAQTPYDIRITPANAAGAGPASTISATTAAAGGAWVPTNLTSLVAAYDTNDTSAVTKDGSNNLIQMGPSYGSGAILPGGSPDVSDTGGVSGNKRVITFASGEYLRSTAAALLAAANGPSATDGLTVIEAVKHVTGATSRTVFFGTGGNTNGSPSIGARQTTSNRGPAVTLTVGGTAQSAFQTAQDGDWHVHSYVKDGNSLIYRVDGTQVATVTLTGSATLATDEFYVGATGSATKGTPASIFPPAAYSGLLVADAALTGSDLTNAEAWVRATAGL